MTAEVWATLPVSADAGHYLVSNLGRVWSLRRDRELKPELGNTGYFFVRSCIGRERTTIKVHRAVALCFVDRPSLDLNVVRHLDGDPLNNVWTNLAWGTFSENNFDMVRHGTHGMARKTHCVQGHPYDDANTILRVVRATGRLRRDCRACHRNSGKLRGRAA